MDIPLDFDSAFDWRDDTPHSAYHDFQALQTPRAEAFARANSLAAFTQATQNLPSIHDIPSPQPYTVHDSVSPRSRSEPRSESQPDGVIPLLQLDDWDDTRSYSEQPPTCVHYNIEWRLTLNSKVVTKDTEQDLVLAPGAYWDYKLSEKLQKLVRQKFPSNRVCQPDETNVTVVINDRGERDLVKRFDGLEIEWEVVERQMERWSMLFYGGKKIRVVMSFNYIETGRGAGSGQRRLGNGSGSGSGSGRGRMSASQRMLAEQAAQEDADEHDTGQSAWRLVSGLMRCGPPCPLGPHCWRDPASDKHYGLKAHHLKSLVRLVEQGNTLDSHADVPLDMREQLYAEARADADRRLRAKGKDSSGLHPITINNILPTASPLNAGTVANDLQSNSQAHVMGSPSRSATTNRFAIAQPPGEAITQYCAWLEASDDRDYVRGQYCRARDLAVEACLDLEQIYERKMVAFFESGGLLEGLAWRWVHKIRAWAEGVESHHGITPS